MQAAREIDPSQVAAQQFKAAIGRGCWGTNAIGHGKSSKPSDGLRASFPKYNYDDMVVAQCRLVTEHLAVRHLRLVLGHSMGGMQTWRWAQKSTPFATTRSG